MRASKLMEASTPNHKTPARQEVLDEIIDEKLKIREASAGGSTRPMTT